MTAVQLARATYVFALGFQKDAFLMTSAVCQFVLRLGANLKLHCTRNDQEHESSLKGDAWCRSNSIQYTGFTATVSVVVRAAHVHSVLTPACGSVTMRQGVGEGIFPAA